MLGYHPQSGFKSCVAGFGGSRHELLKLAEKRDRKGACWIFRTDKILEDEAVGIFTVPQANV